MKTILLTTALLTGFASSAYAKCDADMKTVLSCKSTPQEGDHEFAGQIADTIEICTKGSKTFIAVEAEGSGPEPVLTKPSVRAGATVFPIEDLAEFSVGSRPFPGKVKIGRLYVKLGSESVSSTFTCK
ncbi:hypothetical protein [Bdellovibrio bacteriovorus]|uniref:hypothetical protein n=1 Tax=Bdellovibrio bacteriovorus TaxID=959 RepID=UPI0035A64629